MADNSRTLAYILSCLPEVQEIVMPYLNRADIINLQVAGVPLDISRPTQRKYLAAHCETCYTGFLSNGYSRCTVGRLSERTRIRRCVGYMRDKEETALVRDAEGRFEPPAYHVARAYHQVCEECPIRDRQNHRQSIEDSIRNFAWPLCKTHSAHYKEASLSKPCTCYNTIVTPWRCEPCQNESVDALDDRVYQIRKKLGLKVDPENGEEQFHLFEYTERFNAVKSVAFTLRCPIPGCGEPSAPAMTGLKAREQMDMCLGCGEVNTASLRSKDDKISSGYGEVRWPENHWKQYTIIDDIVFDNDMIEPKSDDDEDGNEDDDEDKWDEDGDSDSDSNDNGIDNDRVELRYESRTELRRKLPMVWWSRNILHRV